MTLSSVIIKPAEDQVISAISQILPDDSSANPSDIKVDSVEIDTDRQLWVINLVSGRPLEEEVVSRIAGGFQVKAPTGIKVEVRVNAQGSKPGTQHAQVLSEKWSEIVTQIKSAIPSAMGFLVDPAWELKGNTLTIDVLGELGCFFLSRPDRRTLVADIIRNLTGAVYEVRFRAKNANEQNGSLEIPDSPACGSDGAFVGARGEESCTSPAAGQPKGVPDHRSGSGRHPGERRHPDQIETRRNEGWAVSDGSRVGQRLCVFGRQITGEPVPISSIQDESKSIVIEGDVLDLQERTLRQGKTMLRFILTDYTDSIYVRLISRKNQPLPAIEDGMHLRLKGRVVFDHYEEELVLEPVSIYTWEKQVRADHAAAKRVELHLHTKMSAMDGITDIGALLETVSRWGHGAVAITDHGVAQAFPYAYEVASKLGVKLIFGVEAYLVDNASDDAKPYHCTILAKNKEGLRNLYRLVTISHLQYFHRHPRIPREEINRHRDGLLIGSACQAGEVFQAVLGDAPWDEIKKTAAFYDYLEVQPLGNNAFLVENKKVSGEEQLKSLNRKICEFGEALGKPVVATGDVHFLEPDDYIYRQILQAGQGYQDSEKGRSFYLRTTEEMEREFSYLGEDMCHKVVVTNPRAIADMVEAIKPVPDGLFAPTIEGADQEVTQMAIAEARRLYGEPLPELVEKRLNRELKAIVGNGFAVIYLIACKLVRKSLDDGYLVGSRGSVGSSLVARLCGITEVNPLPPHYRCPECLYSEFVLDGSLDSGFDLPAKTCPRCGHNLAKDGHDIPFEVFMGFEGDKVPDIDLNFSGENQSDIHKYTETLLGKDCVFRAGTIATIADKTAYGFVRGYVQDNALTLRKAEVCRLAHGLTGVKRTTGQHPGGVMILPKGLDVADFTPLQHPADDRTSGTITTHFDYESISSRLVKLDILGHDDPTAIRLLQDMTGSEAMAIPFDDERTLSIFSSAKDLAVDETIFNPTVGSIGIPEFGTRFVRGMLEVTRPRTFGELVRISGLSHGTDVWLNNAFDLIKSNTANLAEVIATRDDIMRYLIRQGMAPSVSFKIMEKVRKGKGLSAEDEKCMLEAGVPKWYVDSCKKIRYMFPRAHAVAYVMMAFRIAYFKVHHPKAFYAVYFTLNVDDLDARLIDQGVEAWKRKIVEIDRKGNEATAKERDIQAVLEVAVEMYSRGIGFTRIDLYRSDPRRYLVTDEGLLPPLMAIPGLGQNAARNIAQARLQGGFLSVDDLRAKARLNRNVIDLLGEFDCLNGLPKTNQLGLF